ncbi:MAG: ferredoxin family protein [Candidatus Hydrogenedentes bacterium]|nr:ferredoxin family protein [Candidatus Hydrogenedentota bacterium]
MTHIVVEPCIKCKFTDCVAVCPVDCFHEGANMLVIDPDECIDCGACVDECPVHAIFPEEDLPEKWNDYIELNAKYGLEWPVINQTKDPMDTAEEFRDVENKNDLFDPAPGEGS